MPVWLPHTNFIRIVLMNAAYYAAHWVGFFS